LKYNINRHKSELDELQETDPEFYKYLKENDANLLQFEGEDEDSEIEEVNLEEESEIEEGGLGKRGKFPSHKEITADLVLNTIERMKAGSLKELQKLLCMFKSACQPYQEDFNDDSSEDEIESNKTIYNIPSPEVYQLVMTACIESLHQGFRNQFGLSYPYLKSELAEMEHHPKWKKLSFCLRSFFQMQIQNLKALESQVQHRQVLYFFLRSLEVYTPLMFCLPKIQKRFYKLLINLWGGFIVGEEDVEPATTITFAYHDDVNISKGKNEPAPSFQYQDIRGECVLRLIQMVSILPDTIVEEIFRKLYLHYAKVVNKPLNEQNAATIAYLTNSVTEIFTLDVGIAYQQAFLYIRQLALHLRNGFMKKGLEAAKSVKSWQFLNCCRLWTKLIVATTTKDQNGLSMLAFPLSQILHGMVALLPSAYYSPLRFHVITCLQQLCAHCKLFIPTAPYLLEVLEFPETLSSVSLGTDINVSLNFCICLPPDSFHKMNVKEMVVQETFKLLYRDIELYRYNSAFTGYALPIVKRLKLFLKCCSQNTHFRKWRSLNKSFLDILQSRIDEALLFRRTTFSASGSNMNHLFEPLLPPQCPQICTRLGTLTKSSTLQEASDASNTHQHLPIAVSPLRSSPIMIDDTDVGEETIKECNEEISVIDPNELQDEVVALL